MTEDLRDLLRERAEGAELRAPDVTAITGHGHARLRRRRGAALGGVVAALLILVGGAGVLASHKHSAETSAAMSTPNPQISTTRCAACTASVSWVEGSVIHEGSLSVDVDHPITRYVRTSSGFVFSDTGGQVWSVVGGKVTRVGVSGSTLVSDSDGTLAAWVDGSGRTLHFVVLDQSTGQVSTTRGTSASTSATSSGGYLRGSIIAVDGDTVYWRDGDKTVQATFAGTSVTTGRFPLPPGWALLTIRDGVAVEQDPQTGRTTAGRVGTRSPQDVGVSGAPLISPDGRFVASGSGFVHGGAVMVANVGTAQEFLLLERGFAAALPTEWLDDDTLAVLVLPTTGGPTGWTPARSGSQEAAAPS